MATLYFKVSSDWEQVVKLRQECEKLEAQLKKMDSRSAPVATKTLETQLESTKQQMMGLVTEAAKAGATMENDLKRKKMLEDCPNSILRWVNTRRNQHQH